MVNSWANELRAAGYVSLGSAQSRGVGIFIRFGLDCKVLSVTRDDRGQFISIDIDISGTVFVLSQYIFLNVMNV